MHLSTIIFIVLSVVSAIDHDKNTFSNYKDVVIEHLHLEWLLDLDNKYVNATVEYNFKSLVTGLNHVDLDIYQMDVLFAYLPDDGKVLKMDIQVDPIQTLEQGDKLVIQLGRVYNSGQTFRLRIRYTINEKARALSFLNKEQTDDKIAPYLFSQCEANNCRSMIPLQDTPSVKFTYSATVLTKDENVNVFMSGLEVKDTNYSLMGQYNEEIKNIFKFEIMHKIPAYLIAIVAGSVVEKATGAKTYVISENKNIDTYKLELADLDQYIQVLVDYIGEYKWELYKIVILPASFPFGGMENPLLTFASPTIIVGDKSGISVAVHEIAHSWFGNTVTCNNWSNMWINEGFCVFLERKGLTTLFKEQGVDHVKIDAINGNSAMQSAMLDYQKQGKISYASIHPETAGSNPDDSFSTIPYEKGYQLLLYLEMQIGVTEFQQLLRDWVHTYEYASADESDFYNFMQGWIKVNLSNNYSTIMSAINKYYNKWVYEPGLPPFIHNFKNAAYDAAINLAQEWVDSQGSEVPRHAGDFNGFAANQKQIFLQFLIDNAKQLKNVSTLELIESEYSLTESTDAELKWRWFKACILAEYTNESTNQNQIEAFIGSVGRMKMVTPIYSTIELSLANQWFKKYYSFYHPIARDAIKRILDSRNQNQNQIQ